MNQSSRGYSSFQRSSAGRGEGYPHPPFRGRGRGRSKKGRGRGRGRGSPSTYAPSYSPTGVGQETSWGTSYSPSTPVDQHAAFDFGLQPILGMLREAIESAQPYVQGWESTPYPEPEYASHQPVQHLEDHDPQQQIQLEREQQWAEDVSEFHSGFSQHEDFSQPYDDQYGGPYEREPDNRREHMESYNTLGNAYSSGESFRGPESSWQEHHDTELPPPLESMSYFEHHSQPEVPYRSQDSYSNYDEGQGSQPYDHPYIAEEPAYRGSGDPSNQPYRMYPYQESVPTAFHDVRASYREEPFQRQSEEGSYGRREPVFVEEGRQRRGTADLAPWSQNRNNRQGSPLTRRAENRTDGRPVSRQRARPDIRPRSSLASSPDARPRSSLGDSSRPRSTASERPRAGGSVSERSQPGSGVSERPRPKVWDERRNRSVLDSKRTKERRSNAGRSNRDVRGSRQNQSTISDGPSSVLQRLGPPSDDQSRPHSPRSTIESRLGPEEPRGSTIQSRLGPHPEKSHIHSRLGPEVSSSGPGKSQRLSPANSRSSSPAFAKLSPVGIAGSPHQDLRVQLEENRRALSENDTPPKPLFPLRTESPAQRPAFLSTDKSKLEGTSSSLPPSPGVKSGIRPPTRSPSANLAERHPLLLPLFPESSMDQSKASHTVSTATPLQGKGMEVTDPKQQPAATPDPRRPTVDLKRPAAVSPVSQRVERPNGSGSVPCDPRPPSAKGLGRAADSPDSIQQILSKQSPIGENLFQDVTLSATLRPPKTLAAKPLLTSVPSTLEVEAPKQGITLTEHHTRQQQENQRTNQGKVNPDHPMVPPLTSEAGLSKSRAPHSRTAREDPRSSKASSTQETKPQLRPRDKLPLQVEGVKRSVTPMERASHDKSNPAPADKSSRPEGASRGPVRPQQHQSPGRSLLSREVGTSTSKKFSAIQKQQSQDLSTLPAVPRVEKPGQPSTRTEQRTGSQLPGESPQDLKQSTSRESRPIIHDPSGQHSPVSQDSKTGSKNTPGTKLPQSIPPSVSQKKAAIATNSEAPDKRSGGSRREAPVPLAGKTKQQSTTGQPSNSAHTKPKQPAPTSHDPASAKAPRTTASSERRLSSESYPGGAPIPVLGPKYVKQPSSSPVVKRDPSSFRGDIRDASKRTDVAGQKPPSRTNSAASVKTTTASSIDKSTSSVLRSQNQKTIATLRETKKLDAGTMKPESPPQSHASDVHVHSSRTDDHPTEKATKPRRASVGTGMVDIQRPNNPTSLPFAGFGSAEKPTSDETAATTTAASVGFASSPRETGHRSLSKEPSKPTSVFSKTGDQDDRGHRQQQPQRSGDETSSKVTQQRQCHRSESATPPPLFQPHRTEDEPSATSSPRKQPQKSKNQLSDAHPPRKQPLRSEDKPSALPPPKKELHRSQEDLSATPPPRKQPHTSQDEMSASLPPPKQPRKSESNPPATSPPRKQSHRPHEELSATPPPRKQPRLEEPAHVHSLQNFRIPKLSETRSQSTTDCAKEKRLSTDSARKRRLSADSARERRSSAGSTRERWPSADFARERKPSASSARGRRSSVDLTDFTRTRSPSVESIEIRRPSQSPTRRRPSAQSTRNRRPSQSTTDSAMNRRPSQEGAVRGGSRVDEPPKPAPPSDSQRSSTCTSVSTMEEAELSDADSIPGLVIDENADSSWDKDTVFSPGNEAGSSSGQSLSVASGFNQATSTAINVLKRTRKLLKPERLAEKIIGYSLVEQLLAVRPGKKKTSLLSNLYTSTRRIMSDLEKRFLCSAVHMQNLQCYYAGFGIAEVTQGMLQSWNWAVDSLFSFEVDHIHKRCQLNVSKWREEIKRYCEITKTHVVTGKKPQWAGKQQQPWGNQPAVGQMGDESVESRRRSSSHREEQLHQEVAMQKQQKAVELEEPRPPCPSAAIVAGGASAEPSQSLLAPARHEVMITPPLSLQSLTDTIRGLQSMEEALASSPSRSPSPLPPGATPLWRTSPLATPTNLISPSTSSTSQLLTIPTYGAASSHSITTPTYSTSFPSSVALPSSLPPQSLWSDAQVERKEPAAGNSSVEQGYSPASTTPVEGDAIPVLPDFRMQLRMQFGMQSEMQNTVEDGMERGMSGGALQGTAGDEVGQQGRLKWKTDGKAFQRFQSIVKKKQGKRGRKRFHFPRQSKKQRVRKKRQERAVSSSEGSGMVLHPQAFSLSGVFEDTLQGIGMEPGQGRMEPSPSSSQADPRTDDPASLRPCLEGDDFNPVAMDLDTSSDDDETRSIVQSPHKVEHEQKTYDGSMPNVTSSTTPRFRAEPASSPVTETASGSIQDQQLESIVNSIKADLEREAECGEPLIPSYNCDQSSLPLELSGHHGAELENVAQFEYPVEQDIEVEETVLSSEFMSTSKQLDVGGHEREPMGETLPRKNDRDSTIGYGGSGKEDTSQPPVVALEVDSVYGQQPPPAIITGESNLPKSIIGTSEEGPTCHLESIEYERADPVMDLQYSASFQQPQFRSSSTEGVAQWTPQPAPLSQAGDRSCMLGPTDPLMPSSPDELQAPLVGLNDRDTSQQPAVTDRLDSEESRQELRYPPGEALFGNSHDFLSFNALSRSVSDPMPFASLSHLSQMGVGITDSNPFHLIGLEAGKKSQASDVSVSLTFPDSLVPTSEVAVVSSVETSVVASIPPADDKRERSLSPGEIVSPSPGPEIGIGMVPDKPLPDPSALSRESSHTAPMKRRHPSSPSPESGRRDRPRGSQSPPYRGGSGTHRYRFRSRSPDCYRRRSRSPPRWRYRRRSRSRSMSPKSRYGRGSSSQSPGSRHWRPHSSSGRVDSPPPARRSSRRRRSRSRSRTSSPRDRRGRGRRSRSVSPLARSRRPRSHSPPAHSKRSRSPTSRSDSRSRDRDRDRGRSDSRTRSGYSSRGQRRHSKNLSPPPSQRRRESTGSESEEELELLELKKQAIMSMIDRDGSGGASDSKSEWEVVSVYESEQVLSGAEDSGEPNDAATSISIPEQELLTNVRAGEEPENSGAEKSGATARKELPSSIVAQSGSSEPAPGASGDSEQREDAKESGGTKEKIESLKEQKVEGKSAEQKPTKSSGGLTAIAATALKFSESAKLSTEPASQVTRVERAVTPIVEHRKPTVGVAKLAARATMRRKTPTSGPSSSTVSRQSSPSLPRPTVSVKVLSGNDKTWDVKEFHIQVSSEESESSDSDSDFDQPVRRVSHPPPPSGSGTDALGDEISRMLTRVRREVEAKSRGAAPLSPPTFDPRLKLESTSSTDSLELPSPPASLPLKQQREYLELQRKLALHERKKLRTEVEGRAGQVQGKDKGKAPISGNKKVAKARESSHSGSESEKPGMRPGMKKSVMKKPLVDPTPTPTPTPPPEADTSETERRAAEESRGRITEYQSAIKSSRSHLESSQRQLTSLVHQLAECESEMEEHELKLELLRKQLKMVEEAHAGCTKKRSDLQDQVRSTRDRISRHSTAIQEVEKKLSEEREGRRRQPAREDTSVASSISALAVKDTNKPIVASRQSGSIGVQGEGRTESVLTGGSSVTQTVPAEASKSPGDTPYPTVTVTEVGTAVTISETRTLSSKAQLQPELSDHSPSSRSQQQLLSSLPMTTTAGPAGLSPAVPEYEIISDAESQSDDVICRASSLAMPVLQSSEPLVSSAQLRENQHKEIGPWSKLAVPSRQFEVEPVSDAEEFVPLSPLETEMVSDSEAAGPANNQKGEYFSLAVAEGAHLSPLEMEMVSDSESQEPRCSVVHPDSVAADVTLKLPPTIEAISDSEDIEVKKLSGFSLSPEALGIGICMGTHAEAPPIPPEASAIKVTSETDLEKVAYRTLEVDPESLRRDYQPRTAKFQEMSRYSPVQVEAISDSDSEVDVIEVSDPPASHGTASCKALQYALESTLDSSKPTTVTGLSQLDDPAEPEMVSIASANFSASQVSTPVICAPLHTETLSSIEVTTNEQLKLASIEPVGSTEVDAQPILGSAGSHTIIQVEKDLLPPTSDAIVDTVSPPQPETGAISSLKIASICSLCPSSSLDDISSDTAFSLTPPSAFDDDHEAASGETLHCKDSGSSRDETKSSVASSISQLQREHSYSLSPNLFEMLTIPPEPLPTKKKRCTRDRSDSLGKEEHGVEEPTGVPPPPTEKHPIVDTTPLPALETSVGIASQAKESSTEYQSQNPNKRKSKPPKRLQLKWFRVPSVSSSSPIVSSLLSPALTSTLEQTLHSALSPGLSALVSAGHLAQIHKPLSSSSCSLPGPGLHTCSSTISSPGSDFPAETAATQTLGTMSTSLEGKSVSLSDKTPGVSVFLTSALMKTLQTVTVGNLIDRGLQCSKDPMQTIEVVRNKVVSASTAESSSTGKLLLGASQQNAVPTTGVSASTPSKSLKATSTPSINATSSSSHVSPKSQAFPSATNVATSSHSSVSGVTSSLTATCISAASHPHTPSSVAVISASQSVPIPSATVSSSVCLTLSTASVQSKSIGRVSVRDSASLCPSYTGKPIVRAETKVVFTSPVPHMQTGSSAQMAASFKRGASSSSKGVTATAPPVTSTGLTKSATTKSALSSSTSERKSSLDVQSSTSSGSKAVSQLAIAIPLPTVGSALQTSVGLNFPGMVPLPLLSTQLGLKLPNWGSLLPTLGKSSTVVAPVHSLHTANLVSSNAGGVSATVRSSTSTVPAVTATASTRSSSLPIVLAVPPLATSCPVPVSVTSLGSIQSSLLLPPQRAMTTSVSADSTISSSLLTKLQSTAVPSVIAAPISKAISVTSHCSVQPQATTSTSTSNPPSAAITANAVLTPDGLFIIPPSVSTTVLSLPRVISDLPLEVHFSGISEAALSLLTARRDTRKDDKGASLAASDTSATSTPVSSMPITTPCNISSGSGSTTIHSTSILGRLTSAETARVGSSASSPAPSQVSKQDTAGSLSTGSTASSAQAFTSKVLSRSTASNSFTEAGGEAVSPAPNQARLVSGPEHSSKPSAAKSGVALKVPLAGTSLGRRGSGPPFTQQLKSQPSTSNTASAQHSGLMPSVIAAVFPATAEPGKERRGSLPLLLARSKPKTAKAPSSLATSASSLPKGIIPLPAISTASASKWDLQGFSTEIQNFQEQLQKHLKEQKTLLAAAVQAQGGASQPVSSMLAKSLDKQESTSTTDAPLSSNPPSATPTVKESSHFQVLPGKHIVAKMPERSSSAPEKLTTGSGRPGSGRPVSSLTKQASSKDKPAKLVPRVASKIPDKSSSAPGELTTGSERPASSLTTQASSKDKPAKLVPRVASKIPDKSSSAPGELTTGSERPASSLTKQAFSKDKPAKLVPRVVSKIPDKSSSAPGELTTGSERPASSLTKQASSKDKPAKLVPRVVSKIPDKSSSAPGELTTGSERPVSSLTKQASSKDKPAKLVVRDSTELVSTARRSSSPRASRAVSASMKQAIKPQAKGAASQQTTAGQTQKESGVSKALKLLGVETSIEQLRQTWLSDSSQCPGLNVEEVLENIRPTPNLSSLLHPGRRMPLASMSRKIATFSPPESTRIIPESVLSAAERLESGKSLSNRETEKEAQGTGDYTPYVSPLLAFRSYRLSPFYRTHSKLPLSSLTHSSKLHPKRILCRFEQLGICNDAKCSAQHLKNIAPSREELVQDLVSYVPTIAGCSQDDLSTVDSNLPELQKDISDKIASFSANLIQAYGGKITDEQLYLLTAHRVNEEIARVNPCGRKNLSYASWGERHWVSEQQDRTELKSGRPLATVPPDVEPSLVGVAEVGGGGGMLVLPPRPALSSDPQRYFSQGERQSTQTTEDRVRESPSDVEAWLQLAGGISGQGEALGCLEEGLESNPSSEELWVEYLRMKSHDSSSSVEDLDAVCTRAVAASQSYAVVFECIRLTTTYNSKQKWIEAGFRVLSTQHSSSSTSHQHLELLLSASLLDQQCGCSQSAADTISTALFARTQAGREVPRHLADLSCRLTQPDRLLACLALIHLVYLGTLPASLFPSSSPEPPARIKTKEPFLIPWREEVELSQDRVEEIRQLFQDSLELCSSSGVSPSCDSLATTSSLDCPLSTQDPANTTPASVQPPSDTPSPMDSENTHLPTDNQLIANTQPPASIQPPKIISLPTGAEVLLTPLLPDCLPLFQNLVLFEATHGSRQQAQAIIEGQLATWPKVVEYWILLARLGENQKECRDVLRRAVLHCPQRAELYYHAARLELSSQDTTAAGQDGSVSSAVQWLQRGVGQFYCTVEEQPMDVQHTLLLYRRLLGQLVPYDYPLPKLSNRVDPKLLKKQLVPLWMCYCLLVELTSNSNSAPCSSEFSHYATEDAFESAVHSVQEGEGRRQLWREYLSYVRSQALQGRSTVQNFKLFSDCVLRSLVAVEWTHPFPLPLYGQPDHYHSYFFHNEVIELLLSCLPFTSSYKLAVLQRFSALFPRNPVLVARLVECALDQTPEQVKLAQGALASYLATDPQCHFLWSMAISVELRLGHTREARWMYHQAVLALPIHAEIWKEFLLFELRELIALKSPPSNPILLLDIVKKTQEIGLNLRPFLKEALRMPSAQ